MMLRPISDLRRSWQRRAPRSVRARTTLVATTAVAAVLVAAVVGLTTAVQRTLVARISEAAQVQVDAVVARLEAGATLVEALEPTRAPEVAAGEVPMQVEILDREGGHLVGDGFFSMPGLEGGISTTGPPFLDPVVTVGDTDLAIAQRAVRIDGELLLVVAASPLGEVVHSVDTIIRLSTFGVPPLLLLVGAITWNATGRTLRPIQHIRTEVEALSSATLDRRVPVPETADEVAALAHTMNAMLARLETAAARQREFVSDAAHELRSPVSTIRTELEVTLAHPDTEGWPATAASVLSETGRLERLIDDLLLLAGLDERIIGTPTPVDLGQLVRADATRFRGEEIAVEAGEGLLVPGQPEQLASLVRNLLDNAGRHATSRVDVAVASARSADGHSVVLTVDDDGPGIPLADRERVFERFTRLEGGRSRAEGGVGLGLAVVDRIVHHHGGSITVCDSPPGGARFVVTLPRAVPRDGQLGPSAVV